MFITKRLQIIQNKKTLQTELMAFKYVLTRLNHILNGGSRIYTRRTF